MTEMKAFDILANKKGSRNAGFLVQSNGIEQYMAMIEKVAYLQTIERQHGTQTRFKGILSRLRKAEQTPEDGNQLL